MHWSKALVLALAVAAFGAAVAMALTGKPVGEYWALALGPPLLVLIGFLFTKRGRQDLRQPLQFRRLFVTYFQSHGWWVLFWLVLIFGVSLLSEC